MQQAGVRNIFRDRHEMKMASITSLRRFSSLAGCTLPGIAMIACFRSAGQRAGQPLRKCNFNVERGQETSTHSTSRTAAARRGFAFAWIGKAPCVAGECKAEARADGKEEGKPETKVEGKAETGPETRMATKVENRRRIVSGRKVIATIDPGGPVRILLRLRAEPRRRQAGSRRNGCPRSWLRNFLAIKLIDGRRAVCPGATWTSSTCTARMPAPASLDNCTSPAILDGVFRRRMWTVPLADGAAAFIGETDFPRDRRAPVPRDPLYATSVFGARPD